MLSIRFSLTSSMLPATLLSIGLTAPIHFLVVYYKYQKRVGRFRGILATMKHSGFPITMTSLTTVGALLTFSFSNIVPIAHLVNFTIIGILVILVFTLATLSARPGNLAGRRGNRHG
jgi:predicted RND superfamily exporter protein